eukprot:720762-Pyramimonas_sp.AAC.1
MMISFHRRSDARVALGARQKKGREIHRARDHLADAFAKALGQEWIEWARLDSARPAEADEVRSIKPKGAMPLR